MPPLSSSPEHPRLADSSPARLSAAALASADKGDDVFGDNPAEDSLFSNIGDVTRDTLQFFEVGGHRQQRPRAAGDPPPAHQPPQPRLRPPTFVVPLQPQQPGAPFARPQHAPSRLPQFHPARTPPRPSLLNPPYLRSHFAPRQNLPSPIVFRPPGTPDAADDSNASRDTPPTVTRPGRRDDEDDESPPAPRRRRRFEQGTPPEQRDHRRVAEAAAGARDAFNPQVPRGGDRGGRGGDGGDGDDDDPADPSDSDDSDADDQAGLAMNQQQFEQLIQQLAAPRASRKLNTYEDGEPITWINFRGHFEVVRRINNWDNRRARMELEAALDGVAKSRVADVLNIHRPPAGAFEADVMPVAQMLDALEARFLPPAASDLSRASFRQAKQGEKESALTFHARLRQLFKHAYPNIHEDDIDTDHNLIDVFCAGLARSTVRNDVIKQRPQTYHQALEVANNMAAAAQVISAADGTPGKGEHKDLPGINAMYSFKHPQKPSQGDDNSCHFCHRPGHRLRDCGLLDRARHILIKEPQGGGASGSGSSGGGGRDRAFRVPLPPKRLGGNRPRPARGAGGNAHRGRGRGGANRGGRRINAVGEEDGGEAGEAEYEEGEHQDGDGDSGEAPNVSQVSSGEDGEVAGGTDEQCEEDYYSFYAGN